MLQGIQHTNNYRFDCGFVLKLTDFSYCEQLLNSHIHDKKKNIPQSYMVSHKLECRAGIQRDLGLVVRKAINVNPRLKLTEVFSLLVKNGFKILFSFNCKEGPKSSVLKNVYCLVVQLESKFMNNRALDLSYVF